MTNDIANIRAGSQFSDVGHPRSEAIGRFSTFPQACLRKLCAGNSGFDGKKRRDEMIL